MARTPLMDRLRKLTRAAMHSQRTGIPADELLVQGRARRRFMQAAAGGIAAATIGTGCASTQKKDKPAGGPSVAVVGAGIAGLHCAWLLGKAGIAVSVYDAADRVGGRMFTKTDLLAPGLSTELGGEFIDSHHADMLQLCQEFSLDLLDMREDTGLIDCAYWFGGKHYSDREVLDALKPFVARIAQDAAVLELEWDAFLADPKAAELDKTSVAAYLSSLGMTGWLRALVEVAFVTEYGLDAGEQSSLNMLSLIGLDTAAARWEAFGESDERYKVKGGNQRVTDELAKRLEGKIETARKLVAVSHSYSGYELSFAKGAAVKADYLVLTVPFTALREVELDVDLPDEKKRAISELGYGMNAKVMFGTSSRPWRGKGYAGGIFSDEAFQLAWDNARMQKGLAGGITLYSGGKAGVDVGKGTPREQVDRMVPGLEKAFPGVQFAENGKVFRMHWPSHAFTKASYACYRPGQWTSICGHEIEAAGKLHFAGEHCSSDFQGYMNGGAETGRVAAEAILAAVRK